MKQKGISSRKILFLNISGRAWFSRVNSKILPFFKKNTNVNPENGYAWVFIKIWKNEDTYLVFCKKIIQNRIQSIKSILFYNFA